MIKSISAYIFAGIFLICVLVLSEIQAGSMKKRGITSVALVTTKDEIIFLKKEENSKRIIIKECAKSENIKMKNDCKEKPGSTTAYIQTADLKRHIMTALALNEVKLPADSNNNIEKYQEIKKVGSSTYNLDLEKEELRKLEAVLKEVCKGLDALSKCASDYVDVKRLMVLRDRISQEKDKVVIIENVNQVISDIVDNIILSSKLTYLSGTQPSLVYQILKTYTRPEKPRFDFVKIGAGSVTINSSPQSLSARITNDFEMTRTEVTQMQWFALMGFNPSYFKNQSYCPQTYIETAGSSLSAMLCSDYPVENISWKQVQTFLERLNAQDVNYNYRLPSEAEWTLASLGNSQDEFFFGKNSKDIQNYAWFSENSNSTTHAVAQKLPNQNGLYDIYGNVAEWVQDDFDLFPSAPQTNYVATNRNSNYRKVIRGGNFDSKAEHCSSASRFSKLDFDPSRNIGFRLVRSSKK